MPEVNKVNVEEEFLKYWVDIGQVVKNEIAAPKVKEYDYIIFKNKKYSKDDPYIRRDFITNEFIYIHDDDVSYLAHPTSIRANKSISINNEYTIHYDKVVKVNIITSYHGEGIYHFRDEESANAFIKKENLVAGKNVTHAWFLSSEVKQLDILFPNYFRNHIKKLTVENILPSQYHIPDSKYYKEIEAHLKYLNSLYGLDTYTNLELEGKPYTFGVEFETVTGSFTSKELEHLNVSSVFDGSLRSDPNNRGENPLGAEYVTGVLKGDSGFKHMHEILKVLKTKCTVDKRAALHVHIGSLDWNSEDIVCAYILGKLLEDQLFDILPQSRKNNKYCSKLKPLSDSALSLIKSSNNKAVYKLGMKILYKEIFELVADRKEPDSNYNKYSEHPKGRHGGYQPDRDHRYQWLNFTNIMFNQRGKLENKTIEFRNHSGTLNYKKTRNWIKICVAFVEFVHNHKKSIIKGSYKGEPITLELIIRLAFPKTYKGLLEYINERRQLFSSESNETREYEEDNNWKNLKTIEIIRCV